MENETQQIDITTLTLEKLDELSKQLAHEYVNLCVMEHQLLNSIVMVSAEAVKRKQFGNQETINLPKLKKLNLPKQNVS